MKATDETVAIKVIPVGEADDADDIQKEIDMLRDCDHPNIVRYLVCRCPACSRSVVHTCSRTIANRSTKHFALIGRPASRME